LATIEFLKSSSVRGLFCIVVIFEYLYVTSRFTERLEPVPLLKFIPSILMF